MDRELDADYLVVGAGAAGLAFTDALLDHDPRARVVLVDRRAGVGGHWLDAYPFVRLHQASAFYGVASTVFGVGVQRHGPEAGLQERASGAEVCAYYDRVLRQRLLPTGRLDLRTRTEHLGGGVLRSLVTGQVVRVTARCRLVDARYLEPDVPATTPPPFAVAEGARVVPVHALVAVPQPASQYVVVGSGKTATDAVVWLLQQGLDPGALTWVRPRDPWMLSREVVQPVPEVFLGMAAEVMAAAASASDLDDLFLRLEAAGVVLRLDRSVLPRMAKAPTLGLWELELLRSVEHVVRLGHVLAAERGRLVLSGGEVALAPDAVVVHCAASGTRHPDPVPIWSPDRIVLQPVRAGFPCFGAALIGYVEATRDDDAAKSAVARPSSYGNSLARWARMTLVGTRNAADFSAVPDVRAWADGVALNPARVPPGHRSSALDEVRERLARLTPPGLARLAELV